MTRITVPTVSYATAGSFCLGKGETSFWRCAEAKRGFLILTTPNQGEPPFELPEASAELNALTFPKSVREWKLSG